MPFVARASEPSIVFAQKFSHSLISSVQLIKMFFGSSLGGRERMLLGVINRNQSGLVSWEDYLYGQSCPVWDRQFAGFLFNKWLHHWLARLQRRKWLISEITCWCDWLKEKTAGSFFSGTCRHTCAERDFKNFKDGVGYMYNHKHFYHNNHLNTTNKPDRFIALTK